MLRVLDYLRRTMPEDEFRAFWLDLAGLAEGGHGVRRRDGNGMFLTHEKE